MTDINDLGYIEEIRQRIGLDKDDTSQDDIILEATPFRRVQLIAGWYLGSEDWANTFKEYCESQGIYWTTTPDTEGQI